DITRGAEILQRSYPEARRLQRSIELTIFHQVDRFSERQIFALADILVAQAGGSKDRARIEFGAGFRRSHRKASALEIGQGLDLAVRGCDDLNIIRINRTDGAQLVQPGLETRLPVALPRGFERI